MAEGEPIRVSFVGQFVSQFILFALLIRSGQLVHHCCCSSFCTWAVSGTVEGNTEADEIGEQAVGELVNIGTEREVQQVPVTKRGSHTAATRRGHSISSDPH